MKLAIKSFDPNKKRLLLSLGVPPALFRVFSIDSASYLTNILIEDNKGNASSYRASRQLETLEYLNTCKFDRPRTIIFESAEHYLIARQVALYFFGRAIAMAASTGFYPAWIYLTSNIKETVNILDTCSLVVYDNASTVESQSVVRIDKLRDAINYHNKPTIIVFQGTKSVEWSRDVLGVRPYGVVSFNGLKGSDDATSVIRI